MRYAEHRPPAALAPFVESPSGRPATPFRLAESSERRVVFSNPELPYPTRILYWLAPDGLLHARIEGTLKGKAASEEWSWKKTG